MAEAPPKEKRGAPEASTPEDDEDEFDSQDDTNLESADDGEDPLDDMIDNASRRALQVTLRSICAQNQENEDKTLRCLAGEMNKLAHEAASAVASGSSSSKRKRATGLEATCAGCGETFELDENRNGICSVYRYHPGDLEDTDDYDGWADDDREPLLVSPYENPWGFEWSCCERVFQEAGPGCKKFRHVPIYQEPAPKQAKNK